ncbi:MAG: hypothetical protein GX963_02165 [Bacteroidales bacterium]|nr:hypothetical protein [Bacteroidales bacterium]
MTYQTVTVPYGTAIIVDNGDWLMICATDEEAHEYMEDMEEETSASENL